MKHYLLAMAAFTAVALPVWAQKSQKAAAPFQKTITAEDLKKHLTIVAGAEMEGRETATPGEYKAAAYLVQQMEALGLKPGNNGQWMQPYSVYRDSMTEASLEVNGQKYRLFQDFSASAANYNSHMSFGEVAYVNMNDTAYKNNRFDVSGRMVLVRYTPPAQQGRNFGAAGLVAALQAKGASTVLVVGDRVNTNGGEPVMSRMTVNQYPNRQGINSFVITEAVAASLLGTDATAEKGGKLNSKVLKAKVHYSYHEKQITLPSNNVLGLLEGSDKKDEYLVITAHYDHIGRQGNVINYGADDDGSGTVAVLELAEAFIKAKAAGKGPRRSILFMTVSGEEKGLWGSAHYGDNPVYPLAKTTANLNIDMIGRIDTLYGKTDTVNYVYLIGQDKLSTELPALAKLGNTNTKLFMNNRYDDPKDPLRIYYRSDHYNFAKNGVPILFYFDGLHADYHRPTDTVDKINFDIMAKRAQLVFGTAWELANRDAMLVRDLPVPAEPR